MWPFKKEPILLDPIKCHFAKGTLASRDDKKKITAIAKQAVIDPKYSGITEIEIRYIGDIQENTEIKKAHKTFKENYVPEVETPAPFARKDEATICPSGAKLIEVSYIQKRSGGMGSQFWFEGYFISLVVDNDLQNVIDARGHKAW